MFSDANVEQRDKLILIHIWGEVDHVQNLSTDLSDFAVVIQRLVHMSGDALNIHKDKSDLEPRFKTGVNYLDDQKKQSSP